MGDGSNSAPTGQLSQALWANYGIVLIDRTGSMMTPRATGKSRCEEALGVAKKKVDDFFSLGGSQIAVWTFSGSSTSSITSGYVSAVQAKNAIGMLDPNGCGPVTPLAQAICQGIDELKASHPSTTSARSNVLAVITDGGENASTGPCSGTDGPDDDTNSWRYKVLVRAMTKKVVLDTDYMTGNYLTAKGGVDPETGLTLPVRAGGYDPDHETLLNFAVMTNGSYELVQDTDARYACSYGSCPAPYYSPVVW
jgi:hypothetical protein